MNEFISWSWYHSLQQSQAHILMHQVLLLFERCTVLQMKIIYILCVFNIIINNSFLVFALDLGKWHRIICTSSINAEIDSVSRKRMSKLMKFYILLCCNVLVALCQKQCVTLRGKTAEFFLINIPTLKIHKAEVCSQCVGGIQSLDFEGGTFRNAEFSILLPFGGHFRRCHYLATLVW